MIDADRSWGAVVFTPQESDRSGRLYALVRHANGGHWDHPKGHAEEDETPHQTALREIREETGVVARIVDGFVAEEAWTLPGGRPKIVTYYLAEQLSLARAEADGEILDVSWLPYEEAKNKITWETGKDVLEAAENYLNSLT